MSWSVSVYVKEREREHSSLSCSSAYVCSICHSHLVFDTQNVKMKGMHVKIWFLDLSHTFPFQSF